MGKGTWQAVSAEVHLKGHSSGPAAVAARGCLRGRLCAAAAAAAAAGVIHAAFLAGAVPTMHLLHA